MLALSDEWIACFESYLQSLDNSGTKRYYSNHLLRFFEQVGSPERATPDDVRMFVNAPCLVGSRNGGQPTKAGTANTRLAILKSFYKFAARFTVSSSSGKRKLFADEDPTDGLKPKPKNTKPKGMSQAQLEAFFAAIEGSSTTEGLKLRDKSLFAFLLYHGRRISEARAMKIEDIFEAEIVDEHGMRRLAWCYRFVPLKQKNAVPDVVELEPAVKEMIDAWLATRGPISPDMALWVAKGATLNLDEAVVSRSPWSPVSTSAINRMMKKYLHLANLPEEYASHVFRHTSAQTRYLAGADVFSIQKTLRHSSILTTQIYLENLVNASDPSLGKLRQQWQFIK